MSNFHIQRNLIETATNITAVAWKRKYAYIDPSLNGDKHRFTTDFRLVIVTELYLHTVVLGWLSIIRVIKLIRSWPMLQSRNIDILLLQFSV